MTGGSGQWSTEGVTATSAGRRTHTEQGLERKLQLLEAATTLFSSKGYANTRIADICAAAGVAKGLFYWYFPTKETLFAELVRTMRTQLRRAQAAAMDADADPLTRIRQGTEASVLFMAEHMSYFALLDVERADDKVAGVLRDGSDVYAEDVVKLVRDAQRKGLIPDGDPRLYTTGILGAVSSFSHALRNGRVDIDAEELAGFVGDWVVAALTSDHSPAAR